MTQIFRVLDYSDKVLPILQHQVGLTHWRVQWILRWANTGIVGGE